MVWKVLSDGYRCWVDSWYNVLNTVIVLFTSSSLTKWFFLFCSSLEHFYICDNGTVSEKRSCQEDGRIFDPIARDCTETVLEGGDLWSFLFYNCFIIVKHICDPGCAMQCLPDCAQTRTWGVRTSNLNTHHDIASNQ